MTPLAPAALTLVLAFAGVFGLAIGSFLNVVVYRVPAGIPLTRESRCPGCDAPVRPWQNAPIVSWLALRGRCASCASAISPRYPLVEAVTGLAFVAVTWFFLVAMTGGHRFIAGGGDGGAALALVLAAYLYLAAVSIALTLIDLDTRRLPDVIVLPSYVVLVVLFLLACLVGAESAALGRALVGMVVLYLFYAVLRFVRPDGMGGGDVKLAGVIGLALGFIGWGALAVGAFAAFVLGGVFGLALIARRKAGRKTAIPFGPWMIAGAWIGIFVGEPLGRWYLGILGLA